MVTDIHKCCDEKICFYCRNADFSETDVNQLTDTLTSFSFHCNRCQLADAYGCVDLRRETIECNIKTLEFWVDGGENVAACNNFESRITTQFDRDVQNKQQLKAMEHA